MPVDTRLKSSLSLQQLAEAVTLISVHSPRIIDDPAPLPREPLLRFWSCTVARLKHCRQAVLQYLERPRQLTPLERHILWEQTEAAAGEIFISDLLSRVWGAILVACDQARGTRDAEPIARHLLLRQMEARQDVLRLMVAGPQVSLDQILQLDRLRKRLERWTDLVCGHLLLRCDVDDFAFDAERAREFGEEQQQAWDTPQHQRVWQMYLLCVRGGFSQRVSPRSLHSQMRLESVASMLACFPAGTFPAEGPLKSGWLSTLADSTNFRDPLPIGLSHAVSGRRLTVGKQSFSQLEKLTGLTALHDGMAGAVVELPHQQALKPAAPDAAGATFREAPAAKETPSVPFLPPPPLPPAAWN